MQRTRTPCSRTRSGGSARTTSRSCGRSRRSDRTMDAPLRSCLRSYREPVTAAHDKPGRRKGMAYVVAATWTAKEGEQDRIRGVIEAMTRPSRAEQGCLLYQGHRSLEKPTQFFLYEAYVDEAAYRSH